MHRPSSRPSSGAPSLWQVEHELKFETDAAGLKAAETAGAFAAARWRSRLQRSTYFDTSSGALWRQGIIMRIRREGRSAPVLCVKLARQDLFARKEFEARCPDGHPDLDLLDSETGEILRNIIAGDPLVAHFETRISRKSCDVLLGGARIEAALDRGAIHAGAHQIPVADIELELKSGEPADLYSAGLELADAMPLRLSFASKSDRGFGQTLQPLAGATKARAVAFEPDITLDEAVTAILSGCLAAFIANWTPFRIQAAPECIHQMRVALRQMRSALKMFARHMPGEEIAALRSQARDMASALGPAREADVMLAALADGPLGHPHRPDDSEALLRLIEKDHGDAYRRARDTIDGANATRFVLNCQSFIARQAWRNGLDGSQLSILTAPARDFARDNLERLRRRALKRGRRLPALEDEPRHELRIALKELRYCGEFFRSLAADADSTRVFMKKLAGLQDLLGVHNDAVTARQYLDALAPAGSGVEKAAGFVAGWNARGTQDADAHIEHAWRKFRKARPFWGRRPD